MNVVFEAVSGLIKDYYEFNPNQIAEFQEEPSALEFMRFVGKNRPFIVRGGASQWHACRKWNVKYLKEAMGGRLVKVAITPKGNADSPLEQDDGSLWFVKPYEAEEEFGGLIDKIQAQERGDLPDELIRYAQTQNDNLRAEYEEIFADVPSSIPFARIALQKSPEAINFWLGNSYSTTALHKDPYENLYIQVLGRKHFVLIPPVGVACVNEQDLPAATYVPDHDLESGSIRHTLRAEIDDPAAAIPFATWDPDKPRERQTTHSGLCHPLRITLNPGDMLYLPALWYHKVSQSCNEEGICCAINYWFDMEFGGSFYPLYSFSREIGKQRLQRGEGE